MKLVSAFIREEPGAIDPWIVDMTFRTPLIGKRDWKGLNQALKEGDIPVQTHIETRRFASKELAQRAIERMGGKVTA